MARSVDLIRFNALRNALYHTARRRSLERWARIFNFAVVVLGTAAVTDLSSNFGLTAVHIGAIVAIVGALQLVFDFAGGARTHQSLQRSYYHILAEIEETSEPSDDHCRRWDAEMTRITADEPPTLRALDAKAYNETIDALEWDQDERLVLNFHQSLLGGIIHYNGALFPKACEVRAADGKSERTRNTAVPAE